MKRFKNLLLLLIPALCAVSFSYRYGVGNPSACRMESLQLSGMAALTENREWAEMKVSRQFQGLSDGTATRQGSAVFKGKTAAGESFENELARRKRIEKNLTVLKNENLLPLTRLEKLRIATLAIGEKSAMPFQRMVEKYVDADHFFLEKYATVTDIMTMVEKLKGYNLLIAGIHIPENYLRNDYYLMPGLTEIVRKVSVHSRMITLAWGEAMVLGHLPEIEKAKALVWSSSGDTLGQELTVQMLFGAVDASGRLPVSVDHRFIAQSGMNVVKNGRLKYTIPEEEGISSLQLGSKIDSLAAEAIQQGAFPGCQVLIAKGGKVIFHKCYGYLTYEKEEPVTPDHLYDWASITKVAGPLPAIMKLAGERKINLNGKMSDYWPPLRKTDKNNLLIKDVLTHQSRLPAMIPFWSTRLAMDKELREKVFREYPGDENAVRISSKLFMDRKYIDTMFAEVYKIPLLKHKRYRYSCTGFYFWPFIIERLTGKDYQNYLKDNFYLPLGATTITYNPYLHFPLSRIVPTECDDYFRKETLRGFVHDEGAAIFGGVSGNAGLFGTANDLAKIFQMYLWKGYYGGDRFFPEKVIVEFTKVQFPQNKNRRGLGFDKPYLDNSEKTEEESYPCLHISQNSYGHSGYTGTFVWADPDEHLLYIFLSNRVHPTRYNSVYSDLRIRNVILQVTYEAMKKNSQ